MADTTFNMVLPALKAVDNLDDTYSISVVGYYPLPPGGVDTYIMVGDIPLRLYDLGDATYALACIAV